MWADVCCSSCDVWSQNADKCVDYDYFIIDNSYHTCSETVANMYANGETCEKSIGSGTYFGIVYFFYTWHLPERSWQNTP